MNKTERSFTIKKLKQQYKKELDFIKQEKRKNPDYKIKYNSEIHF